MSFSDQLKDHIKPWHLLSHPFYQDWMAGNLSNETLQTYAKEYHTHVKAFPQYISATHSLSDDLEKRRVLLENLNDEEGFNGTDHPTLWAQFAKGLGVSDKDLQAEQNDMAIENVVQTFMDAARSSYHQGLASLYAYEYQIPEVAETKIIGLKEHYNLSDKKSLEFFQVHKEADKFHRAACEKLLDVFNEDEQKEALQAAEKSAQALWYFLTSVHQRHHAA